MPVFTDKTPLRMKNQGTFKCTIGYFDDIKYEVKKLFLKLKKRICFTLFWEAPAKLTSINRIGKNSIKPKRFAHAVY